MYTDNYGHIELITGSHIKFLGKSHRNLLEVKVDGGTENCKLPLTVYRRVFSNNFIADGLTQA